MAGLKGAGFARVFSVVAERVHPSALPWNIFPGALSKPRFVLPTENAQRGVANQGWNIDTLVRQSRILGAGHGRFAAQAVTAGTAIAAKPMVEMARVDALSSLPADRLVTFASADDLEKFVSLAADEGDLERSQVLDLFANFIGCVDGQTPFLAISSWNANHGDNIAGGENFIFVQKTMRDGSLVLLGEAIADIEKDEELLQDYRLFHYPEFFSRYCREEGIKDVRTTTMEAIGYL